MAARPPAHTVVRMSFAAIVFTTLAVVILALIALGLWRRRPSDIWEEDVVRSAAVRSSVEQRDVEEILAGESADAGPVPARGRPGSADTEGEAGQDRQGGVKAA